MTSQAVLTARLDRVVSRLVTDATKGEKPVSKRKHRQLKRRFDSALREMTLDSYVAWCNRDPGGNLMGADGWRERGVTTALGLARILDAEWRKEAAELARYPDEMDEAA